jgi:hypothetical protein
MATILRLYNWSHTERSYPLNPGHSDIFILCLQSPTSSPTVGWPSLPSSLCRRRDPWCVIHGEPRRGTPEIVLPPSSCRVRIAGCHRRPIIGIGQQSCRQPQQCPKTVRLLRSARVLAGTRPAADLHGVASVGTGSFVWDFAIGRLLCRSNVHLAWSPA